MSQNEENSRHARNQNKYRRMNPQDYQNNQSGAADNRGRSRGQDANQSNQSNNQYGQNEMNTSYRGQAQNQNYGQNQNNYQNQNQNSGQNSNQNSVQNSNQNRGNSNSNAFFNPRRQSKSNRSSSNNSNSNSTNQANRGGGNSASGFGSNNGNNGNNGNYGTNGGNGGGRYPEDGQYDSYNQPRPQKGGGNNNQQPPQQKRRKKHHILRTLLIILLLIIGVIGVQYYRGVQAAKKDIGAATVTETFKGSKAADGSTNILLIGSDLRPSSTTTSRADTIMILHLAKGQKQPKLVSIMRDTYVAIPGHGSNKINAAYAYGGADLLRQTIEQNFGITLRYYVRVDFQSFESVVDQLYPKGVQINAEKDLNLDGVTIKAGEQKMTGHVLLQYARFRHDTEGDFGRVRRQQQVINALIQQAKNPVTLFNLPKATGAAMTYTSTNLPVTFTVAQAASYLFKGATGVDRLSIPVDNSWSYGSYADAGSVIEINFDTNKQAISTFFAK